MSERETLSRNIDQIISNILINQNLGLEYLNVKNGYIVGRGADSFVIDYEGRAYKFYGHGYGHKPVKPEKISLYQETTNKAKRFLETKKITFDVQDETYPLIVNSYDEILISNKYSVIVGNTPFIAGPTMDEAKLAYNPVVDHFLINTSVQINVQLGISGVNLLPSNIKLRSGTLVITDLCPNVDKLRTFGKPVFK